MKCEVQHLDKNIRYRILIINGEQYILDMERSFWKIIFPFLFWLVPSPVYKVEDQAIAEELKAPKRKKADSSLFVFLGGVAYVIGILLTPLMNYFEIPSSSLVNTMLLIIALIFVAMLYFSISRNRRRKLDHIVELEKLEKNELWIRPMSIKQIFKLSLFFIWFLGFVLLSFLLYIDTRNIIVLIIGSGLLFAFLLASRITVEEGHTTVKLKD